MTAQQRHEQQRQQRRAQAIEGRTNLAIEPAADPEQPALDQAGKRQQHADAGHRGPLAKQRGRIIEQPQMGELPIEAAIARVAVEAHRSRLTVIRRGDRIDLRPPVRSGFAVRIAEVMAENTSGLVDPEGRHGDWIRLLRRSGFEIEDLVEVYPPADATTRYQFVTLEWARQWPCEDVWKAKKLA